MVLYCTAAACLHVLQALNVLPARTSCRPMMALSLGALETWTRALGTCKPSCIGKSARLFFMPEARDPQETTGHAVVAPKPSQ
jgi:hypothetical protein